MKPYLCTVLGRPPVQAVFCNEFGFFLPTQKLFPKKTTDDVFLNFFLNFQFNPQTPKDRIFLEEFFSESIKQKGDPVLEIFMAENKFGMWGAPC